MATKQRTREHIIADLSVNFAERQILLAGFVAERVFFDYGYDLTVRTFDENGNIERGCYFLQLKASDAPAYSSNREFVSVRVDSRDAEAWREEVLPVGLIVYDAQSEQAFWTHFQAEPVTEAQTIRISTLQVSDRQAVRTLREIKNRQGRF